MTTGELVAMISQQDESLRSSGISQLNPQGLGYHRASSAVIGRLLVTSRERSVAIGWREMFGQ